VVGQGGLPRGLEKPIPSGTDLSGDYPNLADQSTVYRLHGLEPCPFLSPKWTADVYSEPLSKWVCSPKPAHPAILTKELFEAVAAKFLRHRGRVASEFQNRQQLHNPELDNRGHFLLSGLLQCSACKARYVAAKCIHSGQKTQVYYVCNTKWRRGKEACRNPNINLAVAEGAALDALFNAVLTEGEIRKFVDAFNLFAGNQAKRS
jgi:hypothetical protein